MSERIMRQNLFVIAQAYSDATGLSMTTVGKKFHGNGSFFPGFLEGKLSCGVDTYFGMLDKFRAAWPKGAKWPLTSVVPRPSRVPYRPPADRRHLPPAAARGTGGRFSNKLGTKIPERSKSR